MTRQDGSLSSMYNAIALVLMDLQLENHSSVSPSQLSEFISFNSEFLSFLRLPVRVSIQLPSRNEVGFNNALGESSSMGGFNSFVRHGSVGY